MAFETVTWKDNAVVILDQKKLPSEVFYHHYRTSEDVAVSIETMIIRGAPAIGVAAAYGLALSTRETLKLDISTAKEVFLKSCERFARTRPTAVNLFWAIERMKHKSSVSKASHPETWSIELIEEAKRIHAEDLSACKTMGSFGAELLPDRATVLTHCNAGALATSGWGSALGVIRSAIAMGKDISVFADETRPFLQGSRLTAWELQQDGIPVTLITDNMAGHFMSIGQIDAVIVGADRIAANGDTANKIGTYTLAVLAHTHAIPFYVAAPLSTIDLQCEQGKNIPIEERSPKEVFEFAGQIVAPAGIQARHPAFDVTPSKYISAIITEKGVIYPPYSLSVKSLFDQTIN